MALIKCLLSHLISSLLLQSQFEIRRRCKNVNGHLWKFSRIVPFCKWQQFTWDLSWLDVYVNLGMLCLGSLARSLFPLSDHRFHPLFSTLSLILSPFDANDSRERLPEPLFLNSLSARFVDLPFANWRPSEWFPSSPRRSSHCQLILGTLAALQIRTRARIPRLVGNQCPRARLFKAKTS